MRRNSWRGPPGRPLYACASNSVARDPATASARWRGVPGIEIGRLSGSEHANVQVGRPIGPPRSRTRRRHRASPSPIGRPRSPGRTGCPSGSGSRRVAPTSVAASTAVDGPSRSGPRGGPQRPTGKQRDIDATGQPRHPGVEGRIPGEVHAHRALDQVADRSRAAVPRPAPMPGGDGGHAHGPEVDPLVDADLADVADRGVTRAAPGLGARRAAGAPAMARRDAPSKWSGWPCEIRTPSTGPIAAGSGVGPSRRNGPSRRPRTGSVRMRTPSSSIRTVAWPR